MANTKLQEAISRFGAEAKAKLAGFSISGQPEDQLRAPLEQLIKSLGVIAGFAGDDINPIGETLISGMQTRPDYAVEYRKALIGFIEVKAPGKGCDPRNFSDAHDKTQWGKLKSLPNLIYTDGNGFTLWRDGKIVGKPVLLEGGIENAGAKLAAPDALVALFADFFDWKPITPKNAKGLAEVSARLCRFLRDEVLEEMEQGNSALKNLKHDWQKLLFPDADDDQFADGYAQAVTFGLLVARAYDIPLKDGIDLAALKLKKSNTLIGTALGILTGDEGSQKTLKTSISALLRVLHEVNWHEVSKDKPEAWLYFYEDFLGVYDNALRKKTGSYYTPPEVVEAMVRLVDEALRGPLFERPQGLASNDVTIADPAVGTGTFLLGVLRHIAETTRQSYGDETRPRRGGGGVQAHVRFRIAVRPVRRGAAAAAGGDALADECGGFERRGDARPGGQSLHHGHAWQSVRRGRAAAAGCRGGREIPPRSQQGQARPADHGGDWQSAV